MPYVCFGNIAVSAYQGGNAGDTWPSGVGIWLTPNGSAITPSPTPDFSSKNHAGTVGASVSAAAGVIGGGSAVFSGSGAGNANAITFANSTDYNVTNITLMAWVKIAAAASQPANILDRDGVSGGTAREFQWRVNGNILEFIPFISGTPQTLASSATVADNTFKCVASTWDGTTTRNFVNGVASGTATPSGTLDSGTGTTLYMGQRANSGVQLFTGTIDRSMFYSIAQPVNWINTTCLNYATPPAMSAPITISQGNNRTLLGVGQ